MPVCMPACFVHTFMHAYTCYATAEHGRPKIQARGQIERRNGDN